MNIGPDLVGKGIRLIITAYIDNIRFLGIGISQDRQIIFSLPVVINSIKLSIHNAAGESLAKPGALASHILPGGAPV